MKVKIEIDGSNAAFFDEEGNNTYDEIARILKNLSYDLGNNKFPVESEKFNLRDINGNVCGFIEISEG